jgi:hypothetical protein
MKCRSSQEATDEHFVFLSSTQSHSFCTDSRPFAGSAWPKQLFGRQIPSVAAAAAASTLSLL